VLRRGRLLIELNLRCRIDAHDTRIRDLHPIGPRHWKIPSGAVHGGTGIGLDAPPSDRERGGLTSGPGRSSYPGHDGHSRKVRVLRHLPGQLCDFCYMCHNVAACSASLIHPNLLFSPRPGAFWGIFAGKGCEDAA
jgi:hypothetical protein